jgi:hypothetical protein
MPDLSIRGIQAWVAGIPAGSDTAAIKARLQNGGASNRAALASLYGAVSAPRPENLDKLFAGIQDQDAKAGWAVVEELGKVGLPAIPELVRLMDYAAAPVNLRAATVLGRMGKTATVALPDIRRNTARGGTMEKDAALSAKALEAIAEIEKQ